MRLHRAGAWQLAPAARASRRLFEQAPAMPRHHFHLTHAVEERDETGVELESLHSARCRGVKMIAQPAPALWQAPL
jgi:hypothetical protein